MRSYDVAVIGAGPAGCWSAYHLARRGAHVALVDGSHPREKPCGGGVTGRALELVSGALDIGRLPARTIRTARFLQSIGPGRSSLVVSLEDDTLVIASRLHFDGMLLRAAREAGAEVVESRVRDLVRDGTGFRITTGATSVDAAFLIGADGANSLVRRRLSRPFARAQLSIATGYFAEGVTSAEIVIELIDDPPGYIWSFPRPSHLAIGISVQAGEDVTAEALRTRIARWMSDTRVAEGARIKPYSWPIPSLSSKDFESLTIGGSGWLLVGDAAGLVDPITREGIYFALLSGERAADALASPASAPHLLYCERVRDEIGRDLACAARYQRGFFSSRFTSLMFDALRNSEPVRAVMIDLIAGRQSYAGLKWRLARTFEIGLAWRMLRHG